MLFTPEVSCLSFCVFHFRSMLYLCIFRYIDVTYITIFIITVIICSSYYVLYFYIILCNRPICYINLCYISYQPIVLHYILFYDMLFFVSCIPACLSLQAPSASLCVAIIEQCSDAQKIGGLLLKFCNKLSEYLNERDSTKYHDIDNTLLVR